MDIRELCGGLQNVTATQFRGVAEGLLPPASQRLSIQSVAQLLDQSVLRDVSPAKLLDQSVK